MVVDISLIKCRCCIQLLDGRLNRVGGSTDSVCFLYLRHGVNFLKPLFTALF